MDNPSDPRQFILRLIESYQTSNQQEQQISQRFRDFIQTNPDCFENNHLSGHITGSALVVSLDRQQVLLHHHVKLNKWLQFGGHSDGWWNPIEVAWRETKEESGLEEFDWCGAEGEIYDLDIHTIPQREDMPQHLHYDVRFVFQADSTTPLTQSLESHALAWIALNDVSKYQPDASLQRMIAKIKRLKT